MEAGEKHVVQVQVMAYEAVLGEGNRSCRTDAQVEEPQN